MEGKTLLGYCFKTLPLRKRVFKIPILPRLPFKPLTMPIVAYIKLYTFPFSTPPYIYILLTVPLFIA